MEALFKYFSGCLMALVALFAPIVPLVWCVVGFIGVDFLTGVWASRADAHAEGREWYFTSHEAWHTAQKMGFAIVALAMAYLIDSQMLDFMNLHLTKLFAGFVCGVEMWSFLENACRISDSKLLNFLRCYVRGKVKQKIDDEQRIG